MVLQSGVCSEDTFVLGLVQIALWNAKIVSVNGLVFTQKWLVFCELRPKPMVGRAFHLDTGVSLLLCWICAGRESILGQAARYFFGSGSVGSKTFKTASAYCREASSMEFTRLFTL